MKRPEFVPPDQEWFWTPEWQAGEREADEQIAAGGGKVYYDLDEMFADLDRQRTRGGTETDAQ